jgi:small subunit ribosomal protein S8
MITDLIGDLFTRIKNACLVNKRDIVVPYSNMKYAILDVLKKEGYVLDVKKVKRELLVSMAFKRRKPVISDIKNISRPGLRVYKGAKSLPNTLRGMGVSVISTSQGVMSGKEAKKKGLGGEVLGEVW